MDLRHAVATAITKGYLGKREAVATVVLHSVKHSSHTVETKSKGETLRQAAKSVPINRVMCSSEENPMQHNLLRLCKSLHVRLQVKIL